MKRRSLPVGFCVIIISFLLSTCMCFADDLELVEIYPKDGYHELMPNNIAIKMRFSDNMTNETAIAANKKAFTITDKKGNKIGYKALHNSKRYPNDIWLQITEDLKPEGIYNLKISGSLVSSNGKTLGSDKNIEFGVRNTKTDTSGYMVLMVLMIGGMAVFTYLETKRKMKKQMEKGDDKVNPYKEAKKTGRSVEEIVAEQEKQRARERKEKTPAKETAAAQATEKEEAAGEKQDRPGVKRVKKKKTMASIGRDTPKVILEKNKKRREAERIKAANANKKRVAKRSKGSKQRQRKKR